MIYSSWNTLTQNVSRLVQEIKDYKCINPKCDSKSFIEGKCSKCHTSNKEIFTKIHRLEEILFTLKKEYFKDGVFKTYKFLDDLYSIKGMNISFINNYLEDINYENIRNKTISHLKKKYIEGTISSNDNITLKSLLLTKENFDKDDLDIMNRMVLSHDMPIELARRYLIEFTKQKAKELGIIYKEIKYEDITSESNTKNDAITQGLNILFDYNFIDRIYMLKDFDIMYKTIFHELAHLKINNDYMSNKINLASYKLVYDDIIKKSLPEGYKSIPNVIKTEAYADKKAICLLNRFKRSYGIESYDIDLHERIKEQIINFNTNEIRLYGCIINYHNLVFAALTKDPTIYDKHEALHIEFKKITNEKGEVAILRRSKEELQEEVDNYNEMRNEVYKLKETFGVDNFKDLFVNSNTKEILNTMGITYDSFIEQSNRNRVRLDVLDSYKGESKTIKRSSNRGFSNISILYLSVFAILLFAVLFAIALLIR